MQVFYTLFSQSRGMGKQLNTMVHHANMSTMNSTLPNLQSFDPRLGAVITQLDMMAPRFEFSKGEIEIITHPVTFYNSLKERITLAKSRIFLSTLYIGKTQDDLIECLSQALTKNKDLKVHILADALRSTRESPKWTSAALLATLVKQFGDQRVDVRLYHTPHLRGIEKALIPRRLNEGWGLQHMKLYGFDDEVMLSGANLSEDYFTNRQDRYYVFKSKSLTDYYFSIQEAISSLSYKVHYKDTAQGYRLSWPTSNKSSEPKLNLARFISDATFLLEPLLKQKQLKQFEKHPENTEISTIVYPVSQFTPLLKPDTSTEKPSILRLLSMLDLSTMKFTFTAGYFNMHPDIRRKLLSSVASGDILTASPKANSFYLSKGISQYLPTAYLYLAKQFLADVHLMKKQTRIHVHEWQNGVVNTPKGWSYHAKGIWINNSEDKNPSITVVGSSNYTRRAYSLDLESNAIIITKDEDLKAQMQNEIQNLMKHSTELTLEDFDLEERKISPGVILATKILGKRL